MNRQSKIPRNQLQMLSLDDFIEDDSIARVIDQFVSSLDLKKLGFIHYDNKVGRPSFPPDVMVKLFLYGYMHDIRSQRKLEKACKVNMELRWLLNGLMPKYRTIGEFRKNNIAAFDGLFLKTIELAISHKLIEGDTLAFDSFPIRASNSKKNNFKDKKLDFLKKHAQEKLDHYLDELVDNTDLDEEQKDNCRDKIVHYEEQLDKYDKIEKQIKQSDSDQLSYTDPDCRVLPSGDFSKFLGYRIQCGADAKHKLVCSYEVSNKNDVHSTASIASIAKTNLQSDGFNALYDKGYFSGPEMEKLVQNDIIPYISEPSNKRTKVYSHSQFQYDRDKEYYTCPAGEILTPTGPWRNKGKRKVRSFDNRQACKGCALKEQCTTRKAGRLLVRYDKYDYVEDNRQRLSENKNYYKLRSQIIEHIFGTIKRHWKLDHALLRTKEKVRGEYALAFTGYNLKRISSILGEILDCLTRISAERKMKREVVKLTITQSNYN